MFSARRDASKPTGTPWILLFSRLSRPAIGSRPDDYKAIINPGTFDCEGPTKIAKGGNYVFRKG